MYELTIPEGEFYNEEIEEFIQIKKTTLQLEHSLIALRKWESKWNKPFLGTNDKSMDEILDYIRCMTLNRNIDPEIYRYIPAKEIIQLIDYIQAPMTAIWFNEAVESINGNRKETITAEIIYYWMITLNIPVEFQKWHLKQLFTLIRVVSIKSQPKKKMGKREAARMRARLNAERRAKYKTKG